MDNNNSPKRRASEPKALTLVSNYNRIPTPLPYLPSDYQPSPDTHYLGPSPERRQRSQSFGHALIESSSSSQFEIVPYHDWAVIARNNELGQMVLYNQDNQSVTVQCLPDTRIDTDKPIHIGKEECPYCHRPMDSKKKETDYMDRNYFRLLASSQTNTASNSPIQSRSNTFSPATDQPTSPQNLNANAFNQGYYSKFFVELNKLGKGFRGSVFLCEHKLDGVKLGKYAIKKVAIGNNHPWLVRMLREVHLLERLRHRNIVSYKHSWLEYNRLTEFGPEVPCLFILMECANGGNLEEYLEKTHKPKEPRKMTSKESKRERIKRQLREQNSFEQEIENVETPVEKRLLTMTEIWSLFLDIVQGLAHLHQQNIVHRDLKPPNLLLQYDDRNGHRGIPRVLISDFGECEDLDEHEQDENRTGATGTLEFMAPEHVKLDPRGRNTVDYSPKADMWSLGMVLYYLCYSRLPYSNITDVDLLREEILSFKEIQFPKSRYDIYLNDPVLYEEANNDPQLAKDIPNELKLLISMLLSTDPSKRPSCNEILSKLKSIQSDRKYKANVVVEEEEEEKQESHKRSPLESRSNSLRKRQRLLHHDGDTIMTTEDPPRLLLDSPQLEEPKWINDIRVTKGLKTITGVLKIASCTYSCSPYSTKAITLYPVILLALLDFWSESNTPSTLLIILHIFWIMATTLFSGLCEA